MSKLFAVLIGIVGALAGFATWLFVLVSGIVDVAEAVKMDPVSGAGVAWGIFQVACAEVAGPCVGVPIVLLAVFLWGLSDGAPPYKGPLSPTGSSAWATEHAWEQFMSRPVPEDGE